MSWFKPSPKAAPFGADLAARVAAVLGDGHALCYGHRDYCGMGLAFVQGRFCYGEVWDGQVEDLEKLAQGGENARVFEDAGAFVDWLAQQTDESLSRSRDENDFYRHNQTLDRERLVAFVRDHESVPLLTFKRWSKMWKAVPAQGNGSGWFGCVYGAYSEPHRQYHNLRHLQECLEVFDEVKSLAVNPALLEAALWFHDVVYDPQTTSENEEMSADLARDALESGEAEPAVVGHIRSLILVTKRHIPDSTPDAALICDIDLAILGREEARFQEYEEAIAQEYAWVPEAEYVKGRRRVLENFLQRESLYFTETFVQRYEARARSNLRWSLERLAARSAAE
ncbi:MAG TPA: hypothetical protein VGE39_19110 [Prosthecobacter sp.]